MIKIITGTKTPLNDIGVAAGICWHSPIEDSEKNIKRAKDCIVSGHGRVEEYPDLTLSITGYSARCIRELYTHIIGTTRLQSSTRYVDCKKFEYYTPPMTAEQKSIYDGIMENIRASYEALLGLGMSKEDAANVLPLGMNTEIVLKINLRAMEHFMNMRMCSRAYKEIRALSNEMKGVISAYSDEWKWIADNMFVPKCDAAGYCTEAKSCGRRPRK